MGSLVKKTAFFFTVLLMTAGCGTPKAQNNFTEKTIMENTAMDFKVLSSGAYGGIENIVNQLVNDEVEYNRLFSQVAARRFPVEYPEYQESKSYVFIAFGKKSSGGLNYETSNVEQNGENLVVTLKLKPKSRFSTMAIAFPYIVLEINKTVAKSLVINYEEMSE
ncbi:MAG: protease complex subunit PrcB family protein [Flavobacteriaceae bacterium]|jgi:hypothetical protein|nr:protease complex subunit PrcB family protein [Flavobacteriaceae bacterium]